MPPYIVTTGVPWGENLGARDKYAVTSRCAVATLEEAIALAEKIVYAAEEAEHTALDALRDAVDDLPESGGTLGPLPDGTVIEVERVLIENLIFRAGLKARYITAARHADTAMSDAEVIDAYNAKEGRP